jgi:hypothetical protein
MNYLSWHVMLNSYDENRLFRRENFVRNYLDVKVLMIVLSLSFSRECLFEFLCCYIIE